MSLPIPAQMPGVNFGYGSDYLDLKNQPVIISGFFWDQEECAIYTFTEDEKFNVLLKADEAVANEFLYSRNPDTSYLTAFSRLPVCLLTENCTPLVTQDGTHLII